MTGLPSEASTASQPAPTLTDLTTSAARETMTVNRERRITEQVIDLYRELAESGCEVSGTAEEMSLVSVVHAMTMQTLTACEGALLLVDGGHLPVAEALARIALEHSVLAQWLHADPGRLARFWACGVVQHSKTAEAMVRSGTKPTDDPSVAAARARRGAVGKVQPITVEDMFRDLGVSELYDSCHRPMSMAVHPSVGTVAWYTTVVEPPSTTEQSQAPPDRTPDGTYWALGLSAFYGLSAYCGVLGRQDYSARLDVVAEEMQATIPVPSA